MAFFRHLNLEPDQHALILGARGTGKSTYIRDRFNNGAVFWIDLLLPKTEDRYARNPERLKDEFMALSDDIKIIVIEDCNAVECTTLHGRFCRTIPGHKVDQNEIIYIPTRSAQNVIPGPKAVGQLIEFTKDSQK